MFYKKRRSYGKRKWMGKAKRTSSRKRAKSTLVTKPMLYRAIRRSEETKCIVNEYPNTQFNSAIGSSGDSIVLLAPISRGTNGSSRIGNRIKPIRMVINGFVAYNTFNSTQYYYEAHMLGVRLFVYANKASSAVANSIVEYNLLTTGAQGTTFTGAAIDFNKPANRDQFRIYADKKWIMNKPYGWTDQSVASGTASSTNSILAYSNTMYRPFTIVLTEKHMPAYLIYDESDSASYPVNFNPLLSIGYCHILNTPPDVTNPLIIGQFTATLYFKDA